MAAKSGSVPVIKLLLSEGALLSSRTRKGVVPLHMAVEAGRLDATKFLLEHGIPLSKKSIIFFNLFIDSQ